MDKVKVNRLAFFGYHGIYKEEAFLGQRFYLDLECHLKLDEAGENDELGNSVRYDHMADAALDVVNETRFLTIEALAEAVAARLLKLSTRISKVVVEIEKPSAPVKAVIDSVSVYIERYPSD